MTYDVIVIGSGAGGLSAAVPLAQAGKRVLVLESHEVPGGYTQSFTLGGYQFSPGVHYVGSLGPGESLRRIYEGLGVSQDLAFCEMNPEGYDHIFVGDERFDFPKGEAKLVARLQERFPDDAAGVARYISTVRELMEAISTVRKVGNPKHWPAVARAGVLLARWAPRTGMDLIEAFVSDPVLKAVLSGQSGDHGLPPSEVSAIVHAGITHHYLEGAWFPRGGGFAIPRAFVRALKRAGGELRLNTLVKRIVLERGRVAGVELADGSVVRAPVVVSNADPHMTFERMIGRKHLDRGTRRKLDKAKYSGSAISLFFAVDMDLRGAGLDSGNFWYYDDVDVNGSYAEGLTDAVVHGGPIRALFLAAPTLKDPAKMHNGHHTCEAFAFVSYEAFAQWSKEAHGAHGEDYGALKARLTERMLEALERRIPGLREHVVYSELATPLTNEHYVNVTAGNLYGIAKTRGQVGPGSFAVKSRIPGLYLAGASTISHGVAGATMSGLAAASSILNRRVRELLQQKGPPLVIYPSENVDAWPDALKARIGRGKMSMPKPSQRPVAEVEARAA